MLPSKSRPKFTGVKMMTDPDYRTSTIATPMSSPIEVFCRPTTTNHSAVTELAVFIVDSHHPTPGKEAISQLGTTARMELAVEVGKAQELTIQLHLTNFPKIIVVRIAQRMQEI
jgi:hypothetical protein